jgi:O-antigen/teichoic acid export membrane protein
MPITAQDGDDSFRRSSPAHGKDDIDDIDDIDPPDSASDSSERWRVIGNQEFDFADAATMALPVLPMGGNWYPVNDMSMRYSRELQAVHVPFDDISLVDTLELPAVSLRDPAITEAPTQKLPAIDVAGLGEKAATAAGAFRSAIIKGTLSLVVREGLLKIIVLGANIILARVLAPKDFGIFVILGFFNTILMTFGTFGLGPAIVQRKHDPTQKELATLFTFQVLIAAALVGIAAVTAPWLASLYHLGPSGVWLIRAMAFGFLLISASATPMSLLERRLSFGRVALIEVSIGVSYQTLAVILALRGQGVQSLVIATLVSTGLGALLTYIVGGWWPRLSFQFRRIYPMLSFGIKYQVNSMVALVKDNLPQTLVAGVVGAAAVGYISWASTLAFYPLMLVSIIGRVTFPAYSRASHDRKLLQEMIEGTIRAQSFVIFPAVAILVALAPSITHVIYTDKWLPALPLFYFLLVNTVVSSVNSALSAALNALGKPGTVSSLMIMWLVLGWALTIPLVLRFGLIGYGIANASISVTVVVVVYVFKRHQPVRILRNVTLPLISATASGVAGVFLTRVVAAQNIVIMLGEALFVAAIFATLEFVIDRHFAADVGTLLRTVIARGQRRQTQTDGVAAVHGNDVATRQR